MDVNSQINFSQNLLSVPRSASQYSPDTRHLQGSRSPAPPGGRDLILMAVGRGPLSLSKTRLSMTHTMSVSYEELRMLVFRYSDDPVACVVSITTSVTSGAIIIT